MRLEDALKMTRFADETHKATLNILYTAYWMKNHMSAALKNTGLTMEQFNVMRILKGKHPEKMCIKDIAGRIIEKNSNVPRIIDRLLAKELVTKQPSPIDKRESQILLTEKGMQLLEEANAAMRSISEEIIHLPASDARELNLLLEQMRRID